LHDNLGLIFSQLVRPENNNIPRSIWYSMQSDSAQRKMLKSAYLAPFAIDGKIHPRAKEDIEWLIKEVQTLAVQRNGAIHAPVLISRHTELPI
jgi:hypothetical protein